MLLFSTWHFIENHYECQVALAFLNVSSQTQNILNLFNHKHPTKSLFYLKKAQTFQIDSNSKHQDYDYKTTMLIEV